MEMKYMHNRKNRHEFEKKYNNIIIFNLKILCTFL